MSVHNDFIGAFLFPFRRPVWHRFSWLGIRIRPRGYWIFFPGRADVKARGRPTIYFQVDFPHLHISLVFRATFLLDSVLPKKSIPVVRMDVYGMTPDLCMAEWNHIYARPFFGIEFVDFYTHGN